MVADCSEHGVPALLLLLTAWVLFFQQGWRQLRTSRWPFALGALGSVTAFLAHGLTDSGWGISSILVSVDGELCAAR
jgi:hypothetical protein